MYHSVVLRLYVTGIGRVKLSATQPYVMYPWLTPLVLFAMISFLGIWWGKARFVARLLTCYASIAACASYGVFASLFLRLLGRQSIAQWVAGRAFAAVICPLTGIRFSVMNEAALTTRPAVFISNHQTELDIAFLGHIFPKYCSITAKKSLQYFPFLGWFMAVSGTVFIDRGNKQMAIKAFDGAVRQMKENGQSVWIFPEGTRSYSSKPTLLPFKKGAFHLAIQGSVPIVPVVVANYAHVFNYKAQRFESGEIKIKGT